MEAKQMLTFKYILNHQNNTKKIMDKMLLNKLNRNQYNLLQTMKEKIEVLKEKF
jgi:hypothetical protein